MHKPFTPPTNVYCGSEFSEVVVRVGTQKKADYILAKLQENEIPVESATVQRDCYDSTRLELVLRFQRPFRASMDEAKQIHQKAISRLLSMR